MEFDGLGERENFLKGDRTLHRPSERGPRGPLGGPAGQKREPAPPPPLGMGPLDGCHPSAIVGSFPPSLTEESHPDFIEAQWVLYLIEEHSNKTRVKLAVK